MNSVNLVGNICNDLDIIYTEKSCVLKFSVAIRKNEKHTNFIRCVAFGKTAELIEEHFKKGVKIGVSGEISTGSYENEEGITVYTTEVVVNSISFCETSKKEEKNKNQYKSKYKNRLTNR